MEILKKIKELFNKIKNKPLMLKEKQEPIEKEKIEKIINNMPKDLNKVERAYYIYLELGKILSEDPRFVFAYASEKEKLYNKKIRKRDENYFGICKSMSELYVSILKDKRVDVDCETYKSGKSNISHVDTLLKINGKVYLVNLISDLSKIQTSRKVKDFGKKIENPEIIEDVESKYGPLGYFDDKTIEEMDEKFNYSFVPKVKGEKVKAMYTKDVLEQILNELKNEEIFKEIVLKKGDVPKNQYLKYKLEYIFENIDKFTEFNNKHMGCLERERYYTYVARKLFTNDELKKIKAFRLSEGGNPYKTISILKVENQSSEENEERYHFYVFSEEEQRYKYKTKEEIIKEYNIDELVKMEAGTENRKKAKDDLELD